MADPVLRVALARRFEAALEIARFGVVSKAGAPSVRCALIGAVLFCKNLWALAWFVCRVHTNRVLVHRKDFPFAGPVPGSLFVPDSVITSLDPGPPH